MKIEVAHDKIWRLFIFYKQQYANTNKSICRTKANNEDLYSKLKLWEGLQDESELYDYVVVHKERSLDKMRVGRYSWPKE